MEEACIKCGYLGANSSKFGLVLCDICVKFSPNTPEELDEYIQEKVNGEHLKPFRKYSARRGLQQKQGMIKKASKGEIMSRCPFGYKLENGKLVPAQNHREIEEIFTEFLEPRMTLTKLAKKHNLSVNGLKKILSNFTYLGKTKFNNNIYNGNHKPLVDAILFNRVQDKLDKIKKK